MPQSIFAERETRFLQEELKGRAAYNRLAIIRVIWFVGAAFLLYLLLDRGQSLAAIGVGLLAVTGFLILLKRHQAVQRRRDRARWLAFINRDEAQRLERKFLRPETGADFADPTHPYAGDLDVFGNHSLFRLLNRTHTYEGSRKLAAYLLSPVPISEVLLRQDAVAELKPLLDWRQELAALAYLNPTVGDSPDELKNWATKADEPVPGYLAVARWVFPAITLVLVGLWMGGMVPGWAVTVSLLAHGLLLSQVAERAKNASEQTFAMSQALKTYRDLLKHLENPRFQSAILHRLQTVTSLDTRSAADAIGKLSQLVENLNFRRNPYFFLLIGIFTLWDIHYLQALDRWKRVYGPHLADWLDALAEAEALNSLAGLAYAHPEYVVPEFNEETLELDAQQVRHPMLKTGQSVANSLRINGNGQTILITGSNMSGKSTFLRTVGTNVVLALAGAVVAADRLVCSPVQVFTSMRTQDSLEENTSSFYAELKRLKTLIDRTRQSSNWPVLYFLDEILKGTNSADRHRGARALILQLHQTTASGFVSTHDVELGELAATHPFVHNYSFRSDVVDGKLHFDYQLQTGVCRSFNASQLMQSIGIQIQDDALTE
ncbi:MutS-like protein [Larkinella arboricola]|uniref:MutS-like protein n=1 Tax=Larkinella arboricola TaxID=643671 RepID=A0A327WYU9_LARAB|nr:DNA mismatch repair protein MutS [Larkinella arboricola]RAJ97916.1 MutS-like protein [Larkinella arboricola]